jgi:hypothetical protein
MKADELYKELLDLAKQLGVTVKRDKKVKVSGICLVDDEPILVIDTKIPKDKRAAVIATELKRAKIDNNFVKPFLRDFIEQQEVPEADYVLVIEYPEDENTKAE